MGHRLTASQEVQQLRQATREAHEATQALHDAIKEARALAPALVADFERVHATEIRQLSNHITQESNRASAELNAAVDQAKEMIFNRIMAGELVLDWASNVVKLRLGDWRFDEHVPPPYPQQPPRKDTP